MMFETVTKLIENRLNDNWTATEISFDNVPFSPVIGTPFIRCQVEFADNEQIGMMRRARGRGFILISVFEVAGTGARTANIMADEIATIFNLWQSGELRFNFAVTERIGEAKEWYQLNVRAEFSFDQCY